MNRYVPKSQRRVVPTPRAHRSVPASRPELYPRRDTVSTNLKIHTRRTPLTEVELEALRIPDFLLRV